MLCFPCWNLLFFTSIIYNMKALLTIDFINEIVDEKGKLASKGYSDFVKEKKVFEKLSNQIKKARDENMLIIHIRVGFDETYVQQPKDSPLFGKAHEFQALKLNTWATEFHKELNIQKEDVIITKHRVNAFYSTELDLILKNNKIDTLYIAGVSTDLAVSSTVRDAHDRDYKVIVLEDCCAAASIEDHENSIKSLSKISKIEKS
jgi:nicotinamidase-related amidase